MRKKSILNILVVDDEEEIGDMFTKWLSLEGHKGQYVLTGKRAIELVQRQYFDFVFLDIVMPGIPAIEVLHRIREISSKTKVIVITGQLADKRLVEEMKEMGAEGYLQKPFRLEDITRVL
jgi:DNA-binding NtrC family response regulator